MPTSMTMRPLTGLACSVLVGGLGVAYAAAPAAAGGATLDVATTGSDANSGTADAPLRTVQEAIDRATPGTTIRLHKGTYSQELEIRSSGSAGAPITVTAAGDGPVTVTSAQAPDGCGARQPSSRRTINVSGGADYWTFTGLTIVNGVYINGEGTGKTYAWHAGLAKKGQWEPRRKVPGTSKNDPVAAKGAVPYLANLLHADLDPSEHIEFIGNTMTGRGIYATLANYGVVKDNTITNILCGTGPGVWVMNFSNFWEVSGNDISKIAASTWKHYMQEGIRFGSAANYNRIVGNTVHDLPGDGRAFNTDVDGSFNLFQNNIATNVAIGFNDQMAGWGNTWVGNRASKYRTYCFGFRLKDATLRTPSLNSSTNMSTISNNTCSSPVSGAPALGIGAVMKSSFNANTFPKVMLGTYVPGYWAKQGNTWNGSSKPPAEG